jgi:isoleucyl-tRNA synthetase
MLTMATVLENRPPFRIILGHALVKDEKGRDMHKSQGNVIWFDEAAERMGADVMRWIFLNQNPAQNLNFGYQLGYETTRKLLTLWNVYNFFITYARIDRYDPKISPKPVRISVLDRWALSRLTSTIERVRDRLDDYDPAHAANAISEFIEDLSLWYVRRSRRRFWRSSQDEDKLAAYTTLYRSLVDLTKTLAPFMPFLAEELYQNLVGSVDSEAPESVHLTPYPEVNPKDKDPALEARMALVRELVSLGRSARERAGIKVRQPLKLAILLLRPEERDGVREFEGLIRDELNLKAVEYSTTLSDLIQYRARPKLDRLGPKHGPRLPKLIQALDEAPQDRLAALLTGNPLKLLLDGEEIELEPDELEVIKEEHSGYRLASDGPHGVAIKTELTPELIAEGLARELVHRVQLLRKEAGFEVTDRIQFSYEGSAKLEAVIKEYGDYIAQEVLASKISKGLGPGEILQELTLGQERLTMSLNRVDR